MGPILMTKRLIDDIDMIRISETMFHVEMPADTAATSASSAARRASIQPRGIRDSDPGGRC